jgi:hypothetical protein
MPCAPSYTVPRLVTTPVTCNAGAGPDISEPTPTQEMTAEGTYPEVLWELADAMQGDGTVRGGRPLTVEETYEDALGC